MWHPLCWLCCHVQRLCMFWVVWLLCCLVRRCQQGWLYLEPIFGSDDIQQQMPNEGRKFKAVDATWRRLMERLVKQSEVSCVPRWPCLAANVRGPRHTVTRSVLDLLVPQAAAASSAHLRHCENTATAVCVCRCWLSLQMMSCSKT